MTEQKGPGRSFRLNNAVAAIPEGDRKLVRNYVAGRKDLIDLSKGNPSVVLPEYIRAKIKEEVDSGFMRYTDFWGMSELKEKVAERLIADSGISADPESEIIITHGVQEGLYIAMRTLLSEGDEVLVPTPHYGNFYLNSIACGAVPVFVPLRENRGFIPESGDLEKAITPKTRVLVYSNPNNPLGVTWPEETIEELAELALRHDLMVITDEVYRDFAEPAPPVSMASLPGMKERTITLQGFSKNFFMMGLRVGYLTGPAGITFHIKQLHYVVLLSPARLAQFAALAALDCPKEEIEPLLADFRERLGHLHRGIEEVPGMSCVKPNGTLFIFPNTRSYGLKSLDLTLKIIDEAGVVTLPGTEFGDAGEGYLRLSVCATREEIDEGVRRLKMFGERFF